MFLKDRQFSTDSMVLRLRATELPVIHIGNDTYSDHELSSRGWAGIRTVFIPGRAGAGSCHFYLSIYLSMFLAPIWNSGNLDVDTYREREPDDEGDEELQQLVKEIAGLAQQSRGLFERGREHIGLAKSPQRVWERARVGLQFGRGERHTVDQE